MPPILFGNLCSWFSHIGYIQATFSFPIQILILCEIKSETSISQDFSWQKMFSVGFHLNRKIYLFKPDVASICDGKFVDSSLGKLLST
jgi:hypothetical protein